MYDYNRKDRGQKEQYLKKICNSLAYNISERIKNKSELHLIIMLLFVMSRFPVLYANIEYGIHLLLWESQAFRKLALQNAFTQVTP